jgi:hypothetical protein
MPNVGALQLSCLSPILERRGCVSVRPRIGRRGHLRGPYLGQSACQSLAGTLRLSGQVAIGKAAVCNARESHSEAVKVRVLAVVESEDTLVHVADQVRRGHVHVGTLDGTLQQSPERFDA